MNTRLQRTVDVRRFHIKATARVAQKRLVEGAMLRWIEDEMEAGRPASAAAMVAEDGLLPGRPLMLGARLMLGGVSLGLLEIAADSTMETIEAVALTERGVEALRTELIEIPEEQIFEVLYAEDPLLPHPLLRIQQATPSAYEEISTRRSKREREPDRLSPPAGLRALCGAALKPILPSAGYSELVVDKIDKIAIVRETEAELYLELRLRDGEIPSLRLQGRLLREKEAVNQALALPPEEAREGWSCESLLRRRGIWNNRYDLVQTAFAELSPDSRRRLIADFDVLVLSPEEGSDLVPLTSDEMDPDEVRQLFPGYLPFQAARINDVPIGPDADESAEQWFRWLLADTTQDYESPATFRARAESLKRKFPGFISKLKVPSQADFAHELRTADRQPAAYFRLQAPLDLPFSKGGR